jgi:hypothetical protein
MRFHFRRSVVVLSIVAVVFPVAARSIDEGDWSVNEPVLALNPSGPDYVILNRSSVGATDLAYAALRALELKNPGVIRSAAAEALSLMYENDEVEIDASGDDFVKTDENLSNLNAGLRYRMTMLVGAAITGSSSSLTSTDVQVLVCGTCDPSDVDLSGVPAISAPWYSSGAAEVTTYTGITCKECGPGETESAFCGGLQPCIDECTGSGSSCQKEEVPLGTSLVDLTLQHFDLRNGGL